MARLNMPTNRKLIGNNVVPVAADVAYGGGAYAWPQFWVHFQRDWLTWVKPQIDYIVGNNVGCNCIRIIGANWAVAAGQITQADYNRDVMQYIDYCASLGVYVYLCGGSKDGTTSTAISDAAMADIHASTFLLAQNRWNVIGIDLLQEANLAGLPNDASLINQIALIKARGVTLPITCSTAEQTVSSTVGGTWIDAMGQYFDHIDWHCYTFMPTMQQLDYLRARYPDKDILIGETGKDQSRPVDEQDRDIASALKLGMSGDSRIRGALVWAITDQDTVNTNQWGCYDATFAARQNRLNVIRRFTGGSLAALNRRIF